jgi:hypothetical protein
MTVTCSAFSFVTNKRENNPTIMIKNKFQNMHNIEKNIPIPSPVESPGFFGGVTSVRINKISVNNRKGNVAIAVETHTENINCFFASFVSLSIESFLVCRHVIKATITISTGRPIGAIIANGNHAKYTKLGRLSCPGSDSAYNVPMAPPTKAVTIIAMDPMRDECNRVVFMRISLTNLFTSVEHPGP